MCIHIYIDICRYIHRSIHIFYVQSIFTLGLHSPLGGHEDIVQVLLQKGLNVEDADRNGWTSLVWALKEGVGRCAQVEDANVKKGGVGGGVGGVGGVGKRVSLEVFFD